MGFGALNFLFAIPAFFTIDTYGRRNLLLSTFPIMALCLLFTGLSFIIPQESDAKITCVSLGIYLFTIAYSLGEGPVPFTYSAEAYPLYIRTQGMSLATATCWFFNFVLSLTWPSLLNAYKPTGAFCWYAAWNVVGFFLVLFFLYVSLFRPRQHHANPPAAPRQKTSLLRSWTWSSTSRLAILQRTAQSSWGISSSVLLAARVR